MSQLRWSETDIQSQYLWEKMADNYLVYIFLNILFVRFIVSDFCWYIFQFQEKKEEKKTLVTSALNIHMGRMMRKERRMDFMKCTNTWL